MNRSLQHLQGSITTGVVVLFGQVVTTTAGTIGSTTCDGFTVVKTATKTGRYTVTITGNANKILGCNVNILGADDAAFTDAKGVWEGKIRDNDVGTGANDGTFEIQFCDADTGADAELQDSASLLITAWVKNSSV